MCQVITRVNYGQSCRISGLAGAVSMAGAGDNLWQVEGGNWQMASGLLNISDVSLHLSEGIESISYLGNQYELNSTRGNGYKCDVAVVATPLDELNLHFDPPLSIPPRKLQHTHATFVRGLLNPVCASDALHYNRRCRCCPWSGIFLVHLRYKCLLKERALSNTKLVDMINH